MIKKLIMTLKSRQTLPLLRMPKLRDYIKNLVKGLTRENSPPIVSKELIRTDHYVYAEFDCEVHESHALSGTCTSKAQIQPLLKELANDVTFYHDKCSAKEVSAVYAANQDVYRVTTKANDKTTTATEFGEVTRQDKTYFVRKVA